MKRSSVTLIELLIFIGILGAVAGILLPFLTTANTNRVRQKSIVGVEQSGIQLMQLLAQRIREAERILDPPPGKSGSILTLQVGTGSQNPTIIAIQGSGIILVERENVQIVSPSQASITDFVVRNASVALERQSAWVSLRMTETIPLLQAVYYSRVFEEAVHLFPNDDPSGDDCGCAPPSCGDGSYTWQVCDGTTCRNANTNLTCD